MENAEAPAHDRARLSKWQKYALGGVGCALAGGLAAAPWAASHAVTDSIVHDDVGPIPTEVKFAPGHTQLDLGIGGNIYNSRLTAHGLGMDIKPAGPPEVISKLFDGDSANISHVVKRYANFYGHPTSLAAGYKQALTFEAKNMFWSRELEAGVPLAIIFGLIGGLAARELEPKKTKQATALGLGVIAALSVGAAGFNYHNWQQAGQTDVKTYAIKSLDGTRLAGSRTDNQALAVAIDTHLKPQLDKLFGREDTASHEFIKTAYESIDEQIESGAISPPGGNETMILAMSDLHANRDMIKVWRYFVQKVNERYGDGTVAFVVMSGDQTYGSPAAKSAIDAMAKIGDGAPIYYIAGNHGGKLTIRLLNGAGLKHVDGSVVKAPGGLSVLGDDDPQLTKLGALLGFGGNVDRPGTKSTEVEAGAKLTATAKKEGRPAILITHEGYEMAAVNGISPVKNPKAYDAWFAKNGDDSGAGPDTVPDQPASLEFFGHWHLGDTERHLRHRTVANSDGSWTEVAELPSAGGAPAQMRISNFSTPWTVPAQIAGAALFTFNNDLHLVTKMQNLRTTTEGQFSAWQPNAIGSADGQPYQPGVYQVKGQQSKQQKDSAEAANKPRVKQ